MNQMMASHVPMSTVHTGPATSSTELLRGIDLNLLALFDVLARERSVTAAAQRVGVTQSAMSHALRRLRELFGDPLLVRGRSGMVLTPRAEALVVPLRSGLVTLGRALAQPSGFEPRSSRRAYSIASPDLFDVLAIPLLLERMRDEAPGVDITIAPVDSRLFADRLETGELDVAIIPHAEEVREVMPEVTAPGLVRRMLFRDQYSCLIRRDHPALRSSRRKAGKAAMPALTLPAYAALDHLLISPRGQGPGLIDRLLEQHGLTRRVALRIPHFYSALAILAKTDLILTAPSALARVARSDHGLIAFAPPLRVPGHSIQLLWHERFTLDPGHAWLRDLLTECAKAAQSPA
jgi:DNA-binding transcriptional LysR family regulator